MHLCGVNGLLAIMTVYSRLRAAVSRLIISRLPCYLCGWHALHVQCICNGKQCTCLLIRGRPPASQTDCF